MVPFVYGRLVVAEFWMTRGIIGSVSTQTAIARTSLAQEMSVDYHHKNAKVPGGASERP